MANTPRRTVRVTEGLWSEATRIAHARGESLAADVIRPALLRYVKRHRTTTITTTTEDRSCS